MSIELSRQKVNPLEKLYKSRFARALVLLSSLSFFGQFGCIEKPCQQHRKQAQVKLAKKIIDIGNQSRFFNSYAVHKGDKYILSIGQIHSDIYMDVTEKVFTEHSEHGVDDLVNNQKYIESLLLELIQRYGVKDVYLEKTPSTWNLDRIRETKEKIKNLKTPEQKIRAIESMHNDIDMLASCDSEKGPLLYALYVSLQHIDGSALPKREQISRTVLLSTIGNDPLISGDRVYVWGGAMKLFAEDRIDIKIADDDEKAAKRLSRYVGTEDEAELEERLRSGRVRPEELANHKEFTKRNFEVNNIREDAAVSIVAEGAKRSDQKFYPLIYGVTHNFSDNVKRHNDTHSSKLGLVNMYEKTK